MADIVLTAATKFIGRAIGRRVKLCLRRAGGTEAMAAKQESRLREPIAIAERRPDLQACLTDQVVFLVEAASQVLPMSGLTRGITLEQADAVVAQLRNG